ncbi:MAG: hypothetical protein JF593_05715 [Novosphingobium sp.]|nr:hypothetical protein [Novosphingobium sp.]
MLAYTAGLIAKIPARTVFPENENLRIAGSVWGGEAVYGSVLTLQWRWAPLTSLANLAYSVDWRLSGGGTDLSGRASIGARGYHLSRVSGQANGTLLDALLPTLPLSCRFDAEVAIDKLVFGGGSDEARGRMRTSPMRCGGRGMSERGADLPAMSGSIALDRGVSSGLLTSLSSHLRMIEIRLARSGELTVSPTENALRLAPALAGLRLSTKLP